MSVLGLRPPSSQFPSTRTQCLLCCTLLCRKKLAKIRRNTVYAYTRERVVDAGLPDITLLGFCWIDRMLLMQRRITPYQWDGSLSRALEQGTRECNEEQANRRRAGMVSIDAYCVAITPCPKNLAVVGAAGCGKTHTMTNVALYCQSRGLVCVSTASLWQRAFLVSGIDLHQLFCIPVRDAPVIASNKRAFAMALVLAMEVALSDELQQQSAEFFSALDIIMR